MLVSKSLNSLYFKHRPNQNLLQAGSYLLDRLGGSDISLYFFGLIWSIKVSTSLSAGFCSSVTKISPAMLASFF